MPISTRDRKLLWARAGGTCTICKGQLTASAKGSDRDVVLGEEAHIVSEEPNGPRYRPMPKKEVDTYVNLILLCPSDHKIVDEQVAYYTEQRLHTLKRKHEQWVKDHVASTTPAIRIRDPETGKPVQLHRIDSGTALVNVVAHTFAAHHIRPEPLSREEAELIGEFFQNISDCIDVWGDLSAGERIEAEFMLSEEITRLHAAGFTVYAGLRQQVIEGGAKAPGLWPVCYIAIRRSDDEVNKTNPTSKATG